MVVRSGVYLPGCATLTHLTKCKDLRISNPILLIPAYTVANISLTSTAPASLMPLLLATEASDLSTLGPTVLPTRLERRCFCVIVGICVYEILVAIDAHVQILETNDVNLRL